MLRVKLPGKLPVCWAISPLENEVPIGSHGYKRAGSRREGAVAGCLFLNHGFLVYD